MSLTFITGIKFYKGILEQLNHVTYIYDPNWSPDNSTKATFPVCFFHVKSMHEVMTAEVSQKQMLFYNSQTEMSKTDPVADSGLLNVVSDNIVIKPAQYKLDVIIPYQDLSILNQSFIYNTETMNAITSALLKTSGTTRTTIASWNTLSQPIIKFYRDLLKTLLVQNTTSTGENFINNVMNQPDYNKNSLETMFKLRRILKMKVWSNWEYKYVVITDYDITKEGTEDGVYEATLTVQEIPIVTMRNKDALTGTKFTFKNKALQLQGEKAIKLLDLAGIASETVNKGE